MEKISMPLFYFKEALPLWRPSGYSFSDDFVFVDWIYTLRAKVWTNGHARRRGSITAVAG